MKLGTKEIPALRLGTAAVLKAYLGGSQVWPLGFDPASLFARGEQGVWYDPSDFSTMFQDSAGSIPVTGVEQPVGLMLDKSKGVALGHELLVNGDFSDGAAGWLVSGGWSIDASNRIAVGNRAANSLRQNNVTTPGKYYSVSFDYSVSRGYALRFQNVLGGDPNTEAIFVFPSSSGRASFIFLASGTDIYLEAYAEYFYGYVSRLSVKEIFGSHARQRTATSRPTLSARYNLLEKTESLADAYWSRLGITNISSGILAPDGTLTAFSVSGSGINLWSAYFSNQGHKTASVYLKKNTSSTCKFYSYRAASKSYVAIASINFDTGVVTNILGSGATASPVGDGWYLCRLDIGTDVGVNFGVAYNTSDVYVWRPDARVANDGVNLPPYQRVNTATDYDTVGFPHYLRFDGVDDWLVTNTITPGTDKVQVFAGVRKMSDAALGTVVELSAEASLNNGAMQLQSRNSASYAIGTRGTAAGNLYSTNMVFVSPITTVICARFNNAGSSFTEQLQFRANGSDMALTNALLAGTTSAGNYLAYPLYIGRRNGGALPFNGRIYSLIVRFGANLPAATIENTEKYVNTKTRAY